MLSMAAHVVFPATAAHIYHHQKEKTGSTHSPTKKLKGAPRLHITTDSRKPWRVYNNLSTADDDGNYRFSRETENSSHLNTYTSSGSKESEESGEESEEDERRIYVGNLAWACTSDELSEHLQGAGTVELVEVIYDRETGRSRGFAFVTMGSMEEATTAVSMYDGVEFMGRRLRVSFPDRSRNELGPIPNSSAFPNSSLGNANKLFVGNLPWGMDDITLENIFSEHGKVLEARIVYDRESGRSRGFGFVTLSSSDEVNEAITKMDGADVQGRPLRVNLASSRPSRQSFF